MKADQRKKLENERKEARERIAKSNVMQFRCSESLITRLSEMARSKNLPVTAMVRDWVSERLAEEEEGSSKVVLTAFEAALYSAWQQAILQPNQTADARANEERQTALLLLNCVLQRLIGAPEKSTVAESGIGNYHIDLLPEIAKIDARLKEVEARLSKTTYGSET